MEDWGFQPGQEQRIFHFSKSSRPTLGPTQGTGDSFLGVKGPGRNFHHSSPPSTEIKNDWYFNCTCTYFMQYTSLRANLFPAHSQQLRLIFTAVVLSDIYFYHKAPSNKLSENIYFRLQLYVQNTYWTLCKQIEPTRPLTFDQFSPEYLLLGRCDAWADGH